MDSSKKILYATNYREDDLSFDQLKGVLPIRNIGIEEIVILQKTSKEDWTKELKDFNVNTKIEVNESITSRVILNSAQKNNVSFIVMNLNVKNIGLRSQSIIKKVIGESSIPVIIIKSTDNICENSEHGIFSNIIFGTDWSEVSEKAFGLLLKLKEIIGILDIVNVIVEKLTRRDLSHLKERLAGCRKRCLNEKIDAETHVYAGQTAKEILTAAKDYKGTMIFLGGVKNKSLFKRVFRLSASYIIAQDADIPVIIVP